MKKVLTGQKLRIPASTFNTMIDAAADFQSRALNRNSGIRPSASQNGIITICNQSGADQEQFAVLGIDSPIILPTENYTEFANRLALDCALPTKTDHDEMFVILQEPIASGAFGKALIVGVCPVNLLRHSGESSKFAGVTDGETFLTAGEKGAQILWEDTYSGESEHLAIVRLPYAAPGGEGNATARVAATSASTTHSGLQTLDGIALAEGDVVLDWRNGTTTLRGLWKASANAWTREGTLTSGMLVSVIAGTLRKDTLWLLDTQGTITPGTTALNFVQLIQNQIFVRARVKTSSAVTHSGLQTIDTIAVIDNDLVFDAPNVYIASSGVWAISSSAPNVVFVLEGSANGPLTWGKKSDGTYQAIAGVYT